MSRVIGLGVEIAGLDAALGDLVLIEGRQGPVEGHVVGLSGETVLVSPYGDLGGLCVGQPALAPGHPPTVPVGEELLGRVLDGLGRPIDDGDRLDGLERAPLEQRAPHPLRRERIAVPMSLGVKAIDTAIPCGRGQRVGIFAGSGVGKSTLLSMIVRGVQADRVVVGLVGERGREVREFIDSDLGPEGLARSVVVVATGDEPALMRLSAAQTATRIAEDFRDRGEHVLLVMDSITRFAMAQREIGLAAGELPASRGYPPSVLSALPRLLERAGASHTGSITALYTVLVEGDDLNDPVADTVRSILDGHIVLSRELANAGHFPSIDVLRSVSRVVDSVTSRAQQDLASTMREHLAAYEEARDLIEVGAYVGGSSRRIDAAIARRDDIIGFLRQSRDEIVPIAEAWRLLQTALGGPEGSPS
ncbi:MAG: FliI/YscN family ATPase [Acidimicrobiales bacterium]